MKYTMNNHQDFFGFVPAHHFHEYGNKCIKITDKYFVKYIVFEYNGNIFTAIFNKKNYSFVSYEPNEGDIRCVWDDVYNNASFEAGYISINTTNINKGLLEVCKASEEAMLKKEDEKFSAMESAWERTWIDGPGNFSYGNDDDIGYNSNLMFKLFEADDK